MEYILWRKEEERIGEREREEGEPVLGRKIDPSIYVSIYLFFSSFLFSLPCWIGNLSRSHKFFSCFNSGNSECVPLVQDRLWQVIVVAVGDMTRIRTYYCTSELKPNEHLGGDYPDWTVRVRSHTGWKNDREWVLHPVGSSCPSICSCRRCLLRMPLDKYVQKCNSL